MARPGKAGRLARLIVLAFGAGPLLAAPSVDALVQAYRDSPSPARRRALLQYAAAQNRTENGALARFALGIIAHSEQDYASAVENLELAKPGLPALGDYIAYYIAASRLAAKDISGLERDLAPFQSLPAPSPLFEKAVLLRAGAMLESGRPAEAAQLLASRDSTLPQPEAGLLSGKAYEAAGDLAQAVRSYQQVYYRYPDREEAAAASEALARLRQSLGDGYPNASPQLMLERIERWIAVREYGRAEQELTTLAGLAQGPEGELAQVRSGAVLVLRNSPSAGLRKLQSLNVSSPEAGAERLYYIALAARRLDDDAEMLRAVESLGTSYPGSAWRLKALVLAGNRYLLLNRPEQYEPLFREAARSFPSEPDAAYSQWKVAWNAYLRRRSDAVDLLRDHLVRFPESSQAPAAMYFLGRSAEQEGSLPAAAAFYRTILKRFPNYYYGLLARERLERAPLAQAAESAETKAFLEGLGLSEKKAASAGMRPSAATRRRINRARLLSSAGFSDWAEAELRFGARTDGQPSLLAVELAGSRSATHERIQVIKKISPDYLSVEIGEAPARFWQFLFPLPYRQVLMSQSQRRDLDPYIVAGLIRQESEFNPRAVSRSRAYGLTQLLPSTGRSMARQSGIRRFRTNMLFQPELNLRLGISYLHHLLTQWRGKWEHTLASYNAGKSRVEEWLTWGDYREPAEFVETIPFTETREYVQAVLRNAALYRQLYGPASKRAVTAPEPVRKSVRPSAKKSRASRKATPQRKRRR